ncbi:NRDE2 protein, partial [Amia calva]|nr:NRDE2 protein [Amia calva]
SFTWIDDLQALPDFPFFIDKKADPANWEYKSLYRGDIARYKRKGNSSLGLNPKTQHITWADSTSEKKKSAKVPDRYFAKACRLLLSAEGFPVLPCAEGPNRGLPSPSVGFIPISECSAEAVGSDAAPAWINPLGIYDASTSLWLQGKGQPEQDKSQAGNPPAQTALAAKVEEFNRKLRENPGDAQTWMEFVRFQDELTNRPNPFTVTESESERGKKSLKVTLEKKIAILDRAIESNAGSVELKLARLELCKELWEPSTLLKEWKKLVFLHPNNTELWKQYLLFSQSQFSTFTVSKVNSIYGKCLTTLSAVHDGCMVSHPSLPGTEEALLAIFLQQCQFLRQTGHSEKAVSLFQAILDFTFFKPDSVKDMTTRQQVEFFEPFWDCGEPRVGERGARGWMSWMRQQERGGWLIPNEPDDDDEDLEDDTEVKDKTLPKWQIWLDVEASRETRHWLPWRPDKSKGQSEEDCEDPDRQVLFDDIGSSMIRLLSPELRFQLLCSFLQFLDIPGERSYSSPFWSVALDHRSILDGGSEAAERPLTSVHLNHVGVSPIGHMTTLDGAKKYSGLCKQGEEFVQNVFEQMMPLFAPEEKSLLSLYWLQYEKLKVIKCLLNKNKKRLKWQGKRSKKLAKKLLKEPENRNSLALWREFAHTEWLIGNTDDSRKVFDTAIATGLGQGLQSADLCELCLLYAQLEVEAMDGAAVVGAGSPAVYILTKLAEGGSYTGYSGQLPPVSILKARKVYENAFVSLLTEVEKVADGSVCAGWPMRVVGLVGCFALFQYLTVGIEAANHVYRQAVQMMSEVWTEESPNAWTGPSALEKLTLMQAELLRFHTRAHVFPLGPLRDSLTAALRLFPGSHSLWKLYVQVENKCHNASRARRWGKMRYQYLFVDHIWNTVCDSGLGFPLHISLSFLGWCVRADFGDVHSTIPENGLSNRIRVLFEHAVESDNGTHCPLLWRLYMHFLVSQGDADRSRGIFYRALQHIPWVKGLYMDAVAHFPERVQEYMDLMTEKELRLRVPMEEVDVLLED